MVLINVWYKIYDRKVNLNNLFVFLISLFIYFSVNNFESMRQSQFKFPRKECELRPGRIFDLRPWQDNYTGARQLGQARNLESHFAPL